MLVGLAWVILLIIIGSFFYQRAKPYLWIPSAGLLLLVYSLTHIISYFALGLFWLIWFSMTFLALSCNWRIKWISTPILHWFRKQQPPFTAAEKVALKAGGVWWEKAFFRGNPHWEQLHAIPKPRLTDEEQAFIDHQVDSLCGMLNDWEMVHDNQDLSKAAWDFIKKERFLGLVIDQQYGGHGFSAVAHSTIVSKIATRSVSAAISIMVPNSLGPAELLAQYGTDKQKDYYLPRLARGEEIPCFGLTTPDSGSDAASLTDRGVVCYQTIKGEKTLGICLNFHKRYITLAPIATLLAIAFQLDDPEHLIGNKDHLGITLALISHTTPGVKQAAHHFPLNLAFMNGTLSGKEVFISMHDIIGGQANAGKGWQMLLECLSIGRGISLPSLATGSIKFCARMTGAYAKIREQFKRPIGDFEGVAKALARIGGLAYLSEATRIMNALAVDANTRPSVASAIAKYHLTEWARKAIDDAMDIHAGRAIQMGPRNYLGFLYNALPICITVEGSNILTRNLIIFGQGLMRCHPYLQQEIIASEHPHNPSNQKTFDHLLWKHLGFSLNLLVRVFVYGLTQGRCIKVLKGSETDPYYRQLTRMSHAFALLTEAAMVVLGHQLKFKEALSARLGDILSYLYMGSSVLKHYQNQAATRLQMPFVHWSLQYCLYQIQKAIDEFLQNFPMGSIAKILRWLIFPWGQAYHYPKDALSMQVAKALQSNCALRDAITRDIYVGHHAKDPSGRVELAFQSLCNAKPLLDKITQAVKKKNISAHFNLSERAHAAFELKIINEQEKTELLVLDTSIRDALAVDEFQLTTRAAKEK